MELIFIWLFLTLVSHRGHLSISATLMWNSILPLPSLPVIITPTISSTDSASFRPSDGGLALILRSWDHAEGHFSLLHENDRVCWPEAGEEACLYRGAHTLSNGMADLPRRFDAREATAHNVCDTKTTSGVVNELEGVPSTVWLVLSMLDEDVE